MHRVGWRCTECQRMYRSDPGEVCDWCGAVRAFDRFEHPAPDVALPVGTRVRCEPKRAVRQPFSGSVVGSDPGRVLVRADDGTGLYRVRPEAITVLPTHDPRSERVRKREPRDF